MSREDSILKRIEEITEHEALTYFRSIKTRTPAVCLAAVKRNVLTLELVPESMLTDEMIDLALKKNGYSIKFIPKERITPERIWMMIESNSAGIADVPPESLTKEMVKRAVTNRSMSIQYVPERLLTDDLCLLAIKDDGRFISVLPRAMIKDELVIEAIKTHPQAIEYLSRAAQTREIALDCSIRNNFSMKWVKREYQDEAFFLEVVSQSPYALYQVPRRYRTHEVCYQGLLNAEMHIEEVPKVSDFLNWLLTEKPVKEVLSIFKGRWIAKEDMPDFDIVMEFWSRAYVETGIRKRHVEALIEFLDRYPSKYKNRQAWRLQYDSLAYMYQQSV